MLTTTLLALAAGVVGRWDLTVTQGSTEYASWLEITQQDGKYAARMVGRSGSLRPVEIKISGDAIEFDSCRGRLVGDNLEGAGRDREGREVKWVGVRAVRPPAPAREPPWGRPVPPFNGKDLTGWTSRDPRGKECWVAQGGVLVNIPKVSEPHHRAEVPGLQAAHRVQPRSQKQ